MARHSKLRILQTDDPELGQLQRNIQDGLEQVAQLIVDKSITSQDLSTGTNTIQHGLKRQPVAWAVTDIDAAETIYRSDWDSTNIVLEASGAVSIRLEVW